MNKKALIISRCTVKGKSNPETGLRDLEVPEG
jgi:hypothetical protein